jgi:hypothetical protein
MSSFPNNEVTDAITAAIELVPEERDMAEALIEIAERYGKFNEDGTGIYAAYTPADINRDANIGVKCANCVLYLGGTECKIIARAVEPEGKCRLAVIPDGVVNMSGKPDGDDDDHCPCLSAACDCPRNDEVCGCEDGSCSCDCPRCSQGREEHEEHDDDEDETEIEISISAAASRPAPKKDRIKGSKRNAPGSAERKGAKSIKFSKKTEDTLRSKMEKHNEKAGDGRRATLAMLKAVYRRGAGAYSSSHRPGVSRDAWAMARVNAFLRLLRSGRPAKSSYTQDNDLLPSGHPKSSRGTTASAIDVTGETLSVRLVSQSDYESPEQAIFSLAEFSGRGYEMIEPLRATWRRAVRDGDDPYRRAYDLASRGYMSRDADLLPRIEGVEQ